MAVVVPSYTGFRYPVEIISHCVWLYHRFPLSFREVEEMMLERGVVVSHETLRQWCRTFGQTYANGLRRRRGRPGDKWHLDEVFIKINGRTHYLWHFLHPRGSGWRSTKTGLFWTFWSRPGGTPRLPPGSFASC
jgi:putative transposase